MKDNEIEVGGVYRIKNPIWENRYCFYRCTGIYLGGLNQEDNIGFESLDKSENGTILVPKTMILAIDKFEKVSGK